MTSERSVSSSSHGFSSASSMPSSRIYTTEQNAELGSHVELPQTASRYTYPILGEDPFIAVWEGGLRQTILRLTIREPAWSSTDVLRRGSREGVENAKTTVILTVIPGMAAQLAAFMEDVQYTIQQASPGIGLELREDIVGRLVDLREIPNRPGIGASIGTEQTGSSTLGGYVVLQKDGFPDIVCGLTAGHCLVPAREYQTPVL